MLRSSVLRLFRHFPEKIGGGGGRQKCKQVTKQRSAEVLSASPLLSASTLNHRANHRSLGVHLWVTADAEAELSPGRGTHRDIERGSPKNSIAETCAVDGLAGKKAARSLSCWTSWNNRTV